VRILDYRGVTVFVDGGKRRIRKGPCGPALLIVEKDGNFFGEHQKALVFQQSRLAGKGRERKGRGSKLQKLVRGRLLLKRISEMSLGKS